jgi:formylglycine-generating enzyme required for sulfatase activity
LVKGKSFTNSSEMVMIKVSPTLWAGKYLVTQEDYRKVMGSNPSAFPGDKKPVDSVSYNDTLEFCAKLTEAEHKEDMLPEGFVYSIPTQAQWETLLDGATLDQAVTSSGVSRNSTANVGSLPPNGLGLYDARGNVWQWCLDPSDKPYRVLRGASWKTFIEINLRSEFRWYSEGPDDRQNYYGFRCVLVPAGGQ